MDKSTWALTIDKNDRLWHPDKQVTEHLSFKFILYILLPDSLQDQPATTSSRNSGNSHIFSEKYLSGCNHQNAHPNLWWSSSSDHSLSLVFMYKSPILIGHTGIGIWVTDWHLSLKLWGPRIPDLSSSEKCPALTESPLSPSTFSPHNLVWQKQTLSQLKKPADGQSGFLSTFIGSFITQSLSTRITESKGVRFNSSWFFPRCIVAMWATLVESREWIFHVWGIAGQ